jgi:hypothetical protein
MNWVASTDGTAAWTFTDARLLNLLTGCVTTLPRFRDYDVHRRMNNSHGTVYGDRTVFLYNFTYEFAGRPTFRVAILYPGDTAWTLVDPSYVPAPLAAAYHNGKIILLCEGAHYWCSLSPVDKGDGRCELKPRWRAFEHLKSMDNDGYVLKFGDGLLWVSVLVQKDLSWCNDDNNIGDDLARALSLTVHVLEEDKEDDDDKMRWVPKDGRIVGDRVLFLGFPASVAMDARKLDMDGGCAYFVLKRCMFKYNFMDGKAKFVKRLRPVRPTDMSCLWLRPQPVIAPIQKIRKGIEAPKKKKQKVSVI